MPKNNTDPLSPTPTPAPERLVSIESQSEFDLFTGERQERLFLKLYVAARTSGLLAAISDRDWKTLCVLATYMDATGFCFPSQAELARAIGCSRQMVSERVNSLARFRFQDQPVLVIANEKHKVNGRFSHNGYRVLPLASLGIFDGAGTSGTTERRKQGPKSAVSRKPDTVSVSSGTGTVELDTNKNQSVVNEIDHSNIRKSNHSNDDFVDNSLSQPISAEPQNGHATPGSSVKEWRGMEGVGEVIKRKRGRPRKYSDEVSQTILNYVTDFAREFADKATVNQSAARFINDYHKWGRGEMDAFVGILYQARSITKSQGGIRGSKFAYFCSVVEDLLGLKDDEEATPFAR
jgi:hypothetical protein